jgi:VRR-NUC domain
MVLTLAKPKQPKPFRLKPPPQPSEYDEQCALARWLDFVGILYCHVGNGEARSPAAGAKLKRMGVKAGVPDILVFDPPPNPAHAQARGVAIEMKTQHGSLSEKQKGWIERLTADGWLTYVCRGFDDAVRVLKSLGY